MKRHYRGWAFERFLHNLWDCVLAGEEARFFLEPASDRLTRDQTWPNPTRGYFAVGKTHCPVPSFGSQLDDGPNLV